MFQGLSLSRLHTGLVLQVVGFTGLSSAQRQAPPPAGIRCVPITANWRIYAPRHKSRLVNTTLQGYESPVKATVAQFSRKILSPTPWRMPVSSADPGLLYSLPPTARLETEKGRLNMSNQRSGGSRERTPHDPRLLNWQGSARTALLRYRP